MHKNNLRAVFAFLLCFALTPASAVEESLAALSPDEARRAIDLLQNEHRRDEAVLALKAIADVAPSASEPAARHDAAAAPEQSAAETPEPEPAEPEPLPIVALEKDGLIVRTLNEVGHWADGLGDQIGHLRQAGLELPAWYRASINTEAGRLLLMRALLDLALIFAVGLALEWALRRTLDRPGRSLNDHAAAAEARTQQKTQREEILGQRQEKPITEETPLDVWGSTANAASIGKTRPVENNVALVQTNREGIERIEAVQVGSENTAGGGPAAADREPPSIVAEEAAAARTAPGVSPDISDHASPGAQWSKLRNLPYAAAALVLDLLPLALFFCAAALMMRWTSAGDENIHAVTRGFVSAYLAVRVTMALVRLLVSPAGHGLRLLKVSPSMSVVLQSWARRFVVIAAFGIALADAVQLLGAGPAGRFAVIKLVSLLVHLLTVALIFQVHRPVAQAILAPAGSTSTFASIRNWLAHIWTFAAAAFVMGTWVVWALGVENGFPKLIHFLGVSGAIMIIARLASILMLGALARAFRSNAPTKETPGGTPVDANWRPDERYYVLARRLVIAVIAACTLVALLQAWGLNALAWFAPETIGRSLISALTTILVAIVVSLVIWELANATVQRRLTRWTQKGDLMRAARLSTLLPMLRSFLSIIIVLIIGLTALNQMGVNTTPLLAGASIVGVAVGFGSQKLVQDFITGIFLLMENAMQVGDWVTVAGVSGTVEYLSMRTVRLRGGDGSLHIVPFSSVSTVNNTNRGIGNASVRISVGYETDVELAIAELKQIGADLRSDPGFQRLIINDIEVWGVDSVDGSMVTLAGQIRCIDKGRWGVQREMNRRILKRFRELGIVIADPRSRLLVPHDGVSHASQPHEL
ncbi:mechanosensitive ion channel family protein [Stutzerimonas zhaodongensis]|uniref:mechanosensitive ion channel family protein n=1 Tax=Stutzerimonas zhaodongensis TaxID=1176257 RepID=UPI0021025A3A|nr:mechanosensitive ion channel domain-containing protein [Stutzerimonas zhaodongensis]MCQ2031215.1 mechanosensitive ion channel [Stutzerimonas zhaodongensis]